MKEICFYLLILNLTICTTFGQTISGNVKDSAGNLPGATVFLNGTNLITATNANGMFKFTVKPGNYQLLVSMLGFSPFIKDIVVFDKSIELNILLEPSTVKLNEIVIRPDKSWFKNLETFKAQFLGESPYSKKCKILNAEILSFDFDKKTKVLKASSDRLLEIENRALGYKIKYLLTNFEYNVFNKIVNYSGYPAFEVLKGTPGEEELWRENRVSAYKGSTQHFLRSLYNCNLEREGFIVYNLINWMPKSIIYDKSELKLENKSFACSDYLKTVNSAIKALAFNDALLVIYTKETEGYNYINKRYSLSDLFPSQRFPEGQFSILNLQKPSILIDANGAYSRSGDLFLSGYMGWRKISDLTPNSYTP
jgi:hypothetical protein